MSETSKERSVTLVGIDLAKSSVHAYGVDAAGKMVFSKKPSRAKLSPFVANLAACTVAMEACGSAHHWARRFRTFGHEVRLIAPKFVKPYVKTNKNDARDAEAIAEAAQRPNMRFVAVKTLEQQDVQAIHRIRSLTVKRRTAQINQIRGLLLEYGLELPQGRAALNVLAEELRYLDARVAYYDTQIEALARDDTQAHGQAQRSPPAPSRGSVDFALARPPYPTAGIMNNGREAVPRQIVRAESPGERVPLGRITQDAFSGAPSVLASGATSFFLPVLRQWLATSMPSFRVYPACQRQASVVSHTGCSRPLHADAANAGPPKVKEASAAETAKSDAARAVVGRMGNDPCLRFRKSRRAA
ncbi:IS110 family transposase [Thiocapsa sp.]|uniref:IS110 family transposase n=1 Tax=Thiocapsa sp. TaxID=2024551 RepID=UPI0035930CC9